MRTLLNYFLATKPYYYARDRLYRVSIRCYCLAQGTDDFNTTRWEFEKMCANNYTIDNHTETAEMNHN